MAVHYMTTEAILWLLAWTIDKGYFKNSGYRGILVLLFLYIFSSHLICCALLVMDVAWQSNVKCWQVQSLSLHRNVGKKNSYNWGALEQDRLLRNCTNGTLILRAIRAVCKQRTYLQKKKHLPGQINLSILQFLPDFCLYWHINHFVCREMSK